MDEAGTGRGDGAATRRPRARSGVVGALPVDDAVRRRARTGSGPTRIGRSRWRYLLGAVASACAVAAPVVGLAADPAAPAVVAAPAHAPVAAAPVVVTDDRGVEVTLDAPPERVVSLLPSLTETVCALGACDRLVGTDRFSDWPAAVRSLPKLGGFEDVQVERLYALRPDVVLAAESTRVLDRLESLGLTVIAVEPRSLEGARRAVELLGDVLALPGEADALLARIDAERRAAVDRVPSGWRGARAYFEVSSTPHAAGESSFIGELLAGLGLGNIVPAALGPFPKLNPEYVVREDPDLILGSEGSLAGMADRPGWGGLSALKKGHACAFEGRRHDVLVRPGPRLGEAAGILADCIASLPPRDVGVSGTRSEDDVARGNVGRSDKVTDDDADDDKDRGETR